jgi:hypothetical protein
MPIEYEIDHTRRVVIARGRGVLEEGDFFEYQKDVWSREEVRGYDELVDMRAVDEVILPTVDRMRALASLSADMDLKRGTIQGATTKLAVIAPQDFAYGLGRMYEAYRSFQPTSTKEVAVFRTAPEAIAFLGLHGVVLDPVR